MHCFHMLRILHVLVSDGRATDVKTPIFWIAVRPIPGATTKGGRFEASYHSHLMLNHHCRWVSGVVYMS